MEPEQQLEQFYENLHLIFRHMKRNQWSEQDTNAITRTQWSILRNVWRSDGCTIGQLAERLEVRPSTMSQMLDRLELAGLVYRETDKRDARTRIIRLTENGMETVSKLKNARVEVLAEPFGRLAPEERQELVRLMGKLSQNMAKRCENP